MIEGSTIKELHEIAVPGCWKVWEVSENRMLNCVCVCSCQTLAVGVRDTLLDAGKEACVTRSEVVAMEVNNGSSD